MAAPDKTWTYLYGIFWVEGQEAGDESVIFFKFEFPAACRRDESKLDNFLYIGEA